MMLLLPVAIIAVDAIYLVFRDVGADLVRQPAL
jgi:hypothetical protein